MAAGLFALAAALAAAGCASAPVRAPMTRTAASAVSQPFRDLNLLHDQPRPVLEEALLDPYAVPSPRDCATITAGLARLDEALGPDIDALGSRSSARAGLGEDLATDAIGGLVGIPYRGIVRRVSGAAEQERHTKQLTLAGFVRRAYLKGVGETLDCGPARGLATPR